MTTLPQSGGLPNTMLRADQLSANVIICCGEDKQAVVDALHSNHFQDPVEETEFRAFHLLRYDDFAVIIAGMGTGALEPVLHEVLSLKVVKSVILVGTAGKMSSPGVKSAIELGRAYVINEAYVAGTGLDREIDAYPLKFRFDPEYRLEGRKTASIVSTDFYYGFSVSKTAGAYQGTLTHLKEDVKRFQQEPRVDLVDMEVGQFYALCQRMAPGLKLNYLAIKGPANHISSPEEQNTHTPDVLYDAFRQAIDVLRIPGRAPTAGSSLPRTDNPSKMIEEIRLYWTIQTATGAVLGFLGSKLDFQKETATLVVSLAALLVVAIGSIYNIVGNYYIRLEGERLGLGRWEENRVTPFLVLAYLVVGGLLGAVIGYCARAVALEVARVTPWEFLKRVPGKSDEFYFPLFGIFVGLGFLYFCTLSVFRQLYHKQDAFSSSYRKYSEPLRRFPFFLIRKKS